jgi:hypothetical protein
MSDDKILKILHKTRVEVSPETFSMIALRDEQWQQLLQNPEHSPRMTSPFMILKDRWEVTLLVDETDFDAMRVGLRDARVERGFRLLSFDVELDFSFVGFLAFVTDKLAAAGVSIIALSAFSRDHVLVKQADLARTLLVLGQYVEELC